jgi:predicted nucleic acid-binding protein
VYHAHRASSVALDTTVPRNFHDAGYPMQLRQYLPHAVVISDVLGELKRQARSRRNLEVMLRSAWPKLLPALSKDTLQRGLEIQELWLEEGDEEATHLGEIYSVLGAVEFGVPLLCTDDRKGRGLAEEENLPTLTSGELACEMVVQGKLREADAWAIYRRSKKRPKRPKFDALLHTAKTASPTAFR